MLLEFGGGQAGKERKLGWKWKEAGMEVEGMLGLWDVQIRVGMLKMGRGSGSDREG